jgi:DnaJ-class molecular chaperone
MQRLSFKPFVNKMAIRSFGSMPLHYDPNNDYYKILGVNHDEMPIKIKAAYYKLAQKYHPDKNPGHEDKFKSISNAYDTLKQQDLK